MRPEIRRRWPIREAHCGPPCSTDQKLSASTLVLESFLQNFSQSLNHRTGTLDLFQPIGGEDPFLDPGSLVAVDKTHVVPPLFRADMEIRIHHPCLTLLTEFSPASWTIIFRSI